jgi:cell division inhibitor SepF
MGVADSFRRAASHFGAGSDGRYDDYDDEAYAPVDDFEREYNQRRSARLAPPVALPQPSRFEFGVVAPQSFDDAQKIADRIRGDGPVIVDLQGCDAALAKRLIDFCSGLVYALDGRLQYLTDRTILVTPSRVELSGEATVGLRAQGLFNQM